MRKIALMHTAAMLAVGFANKAAAERTAPELTEVLNLALPERAPRRAGSVSVYPFDSLTEVGQWFGVKNKDKRAMSSVISNQNKKYRVQAKDENGQPMFKMNAMKGPDGSVTEVADTSKPIYTHTKKFEAREVDAETAKVLKGTKAEGSKVLVVRIA
jgi:hypothetical protein